MRTVRQPVRVAIIERDADTRLLVRLATEFDPRYDLVGEYVDVTTAITELLANDVDVLIVDQLAPGPAGVEDLARLRIAAGRARIVVVGGDQPAAAAVAAGADAFLDPAAFRQVTNALHLAAGRLEPAA